MMSRPNMPSVSLDSPGLRNIDPGTSHKAAIETKIQAQVYFPKMFEAIKAKGPMPQREIAAATGMAEIPCSPVLRLM
jgi:hypothetical protein